MEPIFSLGDVARLVNVPGYKIVYAISTGALPEASCRLANKRCFTAADVARVARHFGGDIRSAGGVGAATGAK